MFCGQRFPDCVRAYSGFPSEGCEAGAVLGLPRRPIHCRAPGSQPSKGKAKSGSCRAAREQTFFARTQKLSPLCTTSLLFVSPGLPVLRGVSGGGAALSPGFQLNLCSLPKHGAHSAAQPPERSFFFLVFLSAEKEKRRVSDAVGKSLSEIKIRHYLTVHTRSTSHPGTEGAFLKNIL